MMNEVNETLWRSIDSNSDLAESFSGEVSFRSPVRCSDFSDYTSAMPTPRKSGVNLEETLLDALKNLQIASTKKVTAFSSSIIPMDSQKELFKNDDVDDLNAENVEKALIPGEITILGSKNNEKNEDSEEIQEKSDNLDVVEEKLDEIMKNVETKCSENCKKIEEMCSNEEFPIISSNIVENMSKAVKSLLKPPSKKITIGISPMLQTKSRSRAPKTVNESLKINMSCSERKTSRSSSQSSVSSGKQQKIGKNVVATIVSTKEGIKLKEEKINNFGIPVNLMKKKKRTETIPFSFTMRDKNSEQQKKKQPMKDSNSSIIQQKKLIKPEIKKIEKLPIKSKILNKSQTLNKENTIINSHKFKMPMIPSKLLTEKRLKERKQFDEKVKQREKEIEQMKFKIEQKKLEKEKSKGVTRVVQNFNSSEIKRKSNFIQNN